MNRGLACALGVTVLNDSTDNKILLHVPLHPSGSSLLKFQNPGLQRSHLCPSTFVLQIQRPATKLASGSFFPSHSPPLTPPTESQLQAENKNTEWINLQTCTRWIVATLLLIIQALYTSLFPNWHPVAHDFEYKHLSWQISFCRNVLNIYNI